MKTATDHTLKVTIFPKLNTDEIKADIAQQMADCLRELADQIEATGHV